MIDFSRPLKTEDETLKLEAQANEVLIPIFEGVDEDVIDKVLMRIATQFHERVKLI